MFTFPYRKKEKKKFKFNICVVMVRYITTYLYLLTIVVLIIYYIMSLIYRIPVCRINFRFLYYNDIPMAISEAGESAYGSSNSGCSGNDDLTATQEVKEPIQAAANQQQFTLSTDEAALFSSFGNMVWKFPQLIILRDILEQKNRAIAEKHQTIAEMASDLNDAQSELDMLKEDFNDYRDQVARDKQEAEEAATKKMEAAKRRLKKKYKKNKKQDRGTMTEQSKQENVEGGLNEAVENGKRPSNDEEMMMDPPAKRVKSLLAEWGIDLQHRSAVHESNNEAEKSVAAASTSSVEPDEDEIVVVAHPNNEAIPISSTTPNLINSKVERRQRRRPARKPASKPNTPITISEYLRGKNSEPINSGSRPFRPPSLLELSFPTPPPLMPPPIHSNNNNNLISIHPAQAVQLPSPTAPTSSSTASNPSSLGLHNINITNNLINLISKSLCPEAALPFPPSTPLPSQIPLPPAPPSLKKPAAAEVPLLLRQPSSSSSHLTPPPAPPSLTKEPEPVVPQLPSKEYGLELMFSWNSLDKEVREKETIFQAQLFDRACKQLDNHIKSRTQLYTQTSTEIGWRDGDRRKPLLERMLRTDWDAFWSLIGWRTMELFYCAN